MARNLKTGWVIIATSGSVVDGEEDGRFIKKEWLDDMAEVYNTRVFTAKIWPEHSRYTSAGTVLALKVEPATEPELAGESHLFAILAPADWLLRANAAGDYTFPSIEVGENYRGTGKFYLKGLGVTDQPASAGVTELKFSKNGREEKAMVFAGHQFDLNSNIEKTNSLVKRIFGFPGDDSPPTPDDDAMTKEQIEAMQAAIAAMFSTQFAELKSELEKSFKNPEGGGEGDGEGEGEEAPVSDTDFTALQDENAALKTRMDTLEAEFKILKDTPAGATTETPEGEGDGGDVQVI